MNCSEDCDRNWRLKRENRKYLGKKVKDRGGNPHYPRYHNPKGIEEVLSKGNVPPRERIRGIKCRNETGRTIAGVRAARMGFDILDSERRGSKRG